MTSERKSLPSLLMVTNDLTAAIQRTAPDAPQTREYTEQLRTLSQGGR